MYANATTMCCYNKHNNRSHCDRRQHRRYIYTKASDKTSHGNNNYCGNDLSKMLLTQLTFAIWCALPLLLILGARPVESAALYSNARFLTKPAHFEPICSPQEEHFVESEGKASSVILQFNNEVGSLLADQQKSCTRILSAPSHYGFIVRLILPKLRRGSHHQSATATTPMVATISTSLASSAAHMSPTAMAAADAINSDSTSAESVELRLNSTSALAPAVGRTCPISIFSSVNPHSPQWRIDPCQLEDTAPEMEDPVRLFHGRVRIVWEHGHNRINSKLMVTVLGKGEECRRPNKHQCLKIGDEPILCISKDLACDGIRHCPNSNEYDSDEDPSLCWKRRRLGEPLPSALESDIFEHFALEVFRKLLEPTIVSVDRDIGTSTETMAVGPPVVAVNSTTTTLRKVGEGGGAVPVDNVDTTKAPLLVKLDGGNDTTTASGQHRRNSTRVGVNSDLSKYGPWGYLMLGMLLCGGALLICGLWASASQHATNNERESAQRNAAAMNSSAGLNQSGNADPPAYVDDPPPAYTTLFPNQKTPSSAALSTLDVTTLTLDTTTAHSPLNPATAATVTTANDRPPIQVDNVASGSSATVAN